MRGTNALRPVFFLHFTAYAPRVKCQRAQGIDAGPGFSAKLVLSFSHGGTYENIRHSFCDRPRAAGPDRIHDRVRHDRPVRAPDRDHVGRARALPRGARSPVFLLLSFLVTRRHLRLSEIKKSLWLLLASARPWASTGCCCSRRINTRPFRWPRSATISHRDRHRLLCRLLFHEKMTRTQVLAFSYPRSASHSSSAPAACMAARRTCAASALA